VQSVQSAGQDNYSPGNWTRVHHCISAQLHKNPNGAFHVHARWQGDSFWVDGLNFSHWESGRISGRLKLVDAQTGWLVADQDFSHDFTNHAVAEATWEVPPGRYEVRLAAGAKKSLGGWWPWKNLDCPGYYSDVELESEFVTITVK
jgi:hypothetical protein